MSSLATTITELCREMKALEAEASRFKEARLLFEMCGKKDKAQALNKSEKKMRKLILSFECVTSHLNEKRELEE
ncbi:hypothetical protein Gbth_010_029 [Gluconobacter thailandicus F149-1 = NBRC 100600]|nr:hypothetical protein [Gluconobacter thailandicus]KXV54463.1 hypothetical protein AD946_03020 [Gluconobacter thailandicus]GAN92492.1 hypothetical protein Gbth_010_029 [Gluconobacter thailandicus F149-1 = NBRC 100600]GBR60153.1 hypothetical protein AA100600_1772 [Gluconobacter thailandicus F149-1 = NBRC 100600]GEL88323.1 hypothetical protein GTH01_26810 [Gluconobacter thailandicus F149-1 = NBRC 100600]